MTDSRTGPGRVEALRSVKIHSLGGAFGLVAVAINAETGNEEFYTWGHTCVYISDEEEEEDGDDGRYDDDDGILLEPRRFELGLRGRTSTTTSAHEAQSKPARFRVKCE